ncbi:MAG: PAS domain S-box protein, partial [Magnetococcales bacterium]|nr:PAS domain S-box protein [Magnetococcales bacterium]
QAAGDGIFGLNGVGQITFINQSAARILGTTPIHLMEAHVGDILGMKFGAALKSEISAMEKTLADGQAHLLVHEHFYRQDGSKVPVEYSVTPLDPENHRLGAVVTFRDVTQRLQTEAELNRLAAAVNQTTEMIIITDPAGHIQYVNPAFQSITGYQRNETLGIQVTHLPETDRHRSWRDKMHRAMTHGQAFRHHFLAQRKDGSQFKADMTWSPVRDPDGRISSHVIIGRDVTGEQELAHHLMKSRRLEAIGTLAGGIAHDFNNILTAILSYTELTMDDLEPSSLEHQNLKEVMDAANRAKDLVKQLLTFSRRSTQPRTPLHLSVEIKKTISLLKSALPDKIRVETHFPDAENRVLADPTQIHQVVMNLCANAAEAMASNGGVITIRLESVQIGEESIVSCPALSRLQPGLHMVLTVEDQGMGIDASTLDRLFEPFFTTKHVGKGSGLGLAVIHGIIQTHDGAIKAESHPGKGSRMQVFFPSVTGQADTSVPMEPENVS